MILACEVCGDTLGYFRGVAERFICEPCLEKALMTGTVPSPSATGMDKPLGATPLTHPSSVPAPVFFSCPSCNKVKNWTLSPMPWHNAVCNECYAELRDRHEDVQYQQRRRTP